MIVKPQNLDSSILYLSKLLPPIQYSYTYDKDAFSLDEELLYKEVTNGSLEPNSMIFYTFLTENDVLEKYIYNIIRFRHPSTYHSLSGAISDAFGWSSTDEGDTFWHRLHNKWDTIYLRDISM